jgi:leucyl aminopeptidase (aminopeptidase T)
VESPNPSPPALSAEAALDNVLERCLAASPAERVVLLIDPETDRRVVELLRVGLVARRCTPVIVEMPAFEVPGSEVSPEVATTMRQCDAVIELTSTFIGSNQARREANAEGVRYLAMPGVTLETFRPGGPLGVDFDHLRISAERVGDLWTDASTFTLTTPAGTELHGSVEGRPGRVLHGICRTPGAYMAPPDIEAGIAPLEGTTHGIAVIDADLLFMGVGPLSDPVVLTFDEGLLVGVEGPESHRLTAMIERCRDDRMSNLAEVSLGLNPAGHVCEVAMETESTLGTAHIALGNSIAYGGVVPAVAHLDCVMRDATLTLDSVPVPAIEIMSATA